MSEGLEDVWVEVGRFSAVREAEQYALALVASGVASRLEQGAGGSALFVIAEDATKARGEIEAYRLENRPPPLARDSTLRPIRDGVDAALIFSIVLVLIHAAASRGAFATDWLSIGSSQASLIRGGEWWRAVTALGLHADLGHLLSNVVLGGILGLLLAQLIGAGLAWFTILVGGALANLAVAFLAPAEHAAIGASTAVFAALGLLAALAWGRQQLLWRGLRRWRPVAAALMLLALLGVGGEHIDVWGHVAGLIAGLVGGAALYFARSFLPQGRSAQLAFGAAAVLVFGGAWIAAFASA